MTALKVLIIALVVFLVMIAEMIGKKVKDRVVTLWLWFFPAAKYQDDFEEEYLF